MKSTPLFLSLSILSILNSASPLQAATDADVAALKEQLRQMGERVRQLQSTVDSLKKSPAPALAATPPAAPAKDAKKIKADEPTKADKALTAALEKTKGLPTDLKSLSEAFDVPNSPAAAVLGMSQDKVQHLKTPKELIPAIINGLDDKGHFQSGVSIEFAPAQEIFADVPVEGFRYRHSSGSWEDRWHSFDTWLLRTAVRTQVSFATAKGTSDADKSSKFALGIHTVLANSDDPLTWAGTAQNRVNSEGIPEPNSAAIKKLDYWGRRLNQYVPTVDDFDGIESLPFPTNTSLLDTVGNVLYKHVSLAVGGAPEWIAKDDEGNYDYAGSTAWGSLAFVPSAKIPARFLLNATYKQAERIDSKDAVEPPTSGKIKELDQDTLFLSGGVRVGTRDFNGTVTGSYLHIDDGKYGSDKAYRIAGTLEARVSDNSWLTLTVSKDEGHSDGKNPTLVLGGMKIGLDGFDFFSKDQAAKIR